ncbi:PseE protein [Campylobacter jejuni]|uniref:motility associated factor glycosyltransferase family protein n=1 Tax=Campylobacter jejuni TaxID=197 RepID=UPI000874105B|nr:motility associated factor glycosyltransferase family protein [Campylobacter jejuni]EHL4788183.1 motility associated factor glycosyltransferase family protein [Campylobacter jejuni]OEW94419.1 PseE protein [Campylobacter jejuni]OEX02176.1 PseE protein [Campylobacter jejuni]
MQINEIFKKNLEAMQGSAHEKLKHKLKNFRELRNFSFHIGSDPIDINIIDKKHLKKIYQNPIKELEENLKLYQEQYTNYPFLFFYGFGNGILYKTLVKNSHHKRIIVVEKELDIIFITLNLIDFSEDLLKGRIVIIHALDYDNNIAELIFELKEVNLFLKTYQINLHSSFYKIYQEDIKKINNVNLQTIKYLTLKKGTDPLDAMIGIEQAIWNLPQMFKHYSYKELLDKRKNLNKNAIIVSTGPSLTRQLPLLKQYANKAIIFCADSSYPILAKHSIKPDYVLSLERIPLTSEFFNNDFGDFDKNILFILPGLTHPNSIKYLNKFKKDYMLVARYLPFMISLDLKENGYIGGGMSVAHSAYELAILLKCENIILIGQDLAYSKEGKSHTEDYVNLLLHEKDFEQNKGRFTTTAYGGKGMVESSEVWTIFRKIFENYATNNQTKINTYNCTEGGARIEGTIEKPFKEVCEELLINNIKKPLKKLKKKTKKEQFDSMLKSYQKIKKNMQLALNFQKECKKTLKKIQKITQKNKYINLENVIKDIDLIREKLSHRKYFFLHEILGPTLHHEESLIAPIYTQSVHNESQRQNKILSWIYANESLIETIIDLIESQNTRLKKAIIPLQDELEKRNLI